MTIPRNGITADRKTPEKIQFIIDNYSILTKPQIAEKIKESPRWVKRQLKKLFNSGVIKCKRPAPQNPLSENDWTAEVKNFSVELRLKFLRPNLFISKALKEKFNFVIEPGALQFWFNKFNCPSQSKQEWMLKYLPKELMAELLNKSYRIVDISKFVKKEFNIYISDDLILAHIQKLGLLSFKLKKIKDIRDKSYEFSKEWLNQKINEHAGISGLSKEMGFSKTVVMKRIKEEGLSLIKHRKIWSKDMERIRNFLIEVPPIENISAEDFHQMILGWLIGDGHLDKGRFVIAHSLTQTHYIYIKIRVLKKFVTNIVTISKSVSDKFYGGKEQIGLSCPGFESYLKYLNSDGSKNYDKIISELNPLGWACYFMDDGSCWGNSQVMAINDKFSDIFENKYCFGDKKGVGLLEVKGIDPQYIEPGFNYKIKSVPRDKIGVYWKSKIPELFNPIIKNDLDLCFVNNYTITQNPSLLNEVVDYYKKRGFPYFSISDDYLSKEIDNLCKLHSKYFWKEDSILRYISTGNYIFKHFMPHMVEAKYRNISPLETFNNYTLFYKVLEYSLKTNKSVLPKFIYDNLIHFNGGVVGFPCTIAKAVVDRYTEEGALVVDPCAGWGGRLLGTVTAKRRYLGFEPWDKTFTGLNNIINFLKTKEASILNSPFDPEKAPKSCDLIFTSPPYIDMEIYNAPIGKTGWIDLINNIFKYAEKALIDQGHLILNIPRSLRPLLPLTSLREKEPVYWFTSARKKDVNKAEILYIWTK